MAKSTSRLDIAILAEGIEELAAPCCPASSIQGYLISKPAREQVDARKARSTMSRAMCEQAGGALVA